MRLSVVYILFISSLPIFNASAAVFEVQEKGKLNSIGKTIEIAALGDTILIEKGNYAEDEIIINKPLTIIGINKPQINGNGKGNIILVKSENVTIKGLIIANTGISFVKDLAGIKLDSAKNCMIIENEINNCLFAIHCVASDSIIINNNNILGETVRQSSSGNGIHLWYCREITVIGNNISGMRDGIYLEFVKNSRINNNHSSKNLRYGLHFMFSDNAIYHDNVFSSNGTGVAVMYTKNVKMFDNKFENSLGSAAYGLLLKDISNSEIEKNLFINNTAGMYIEGGGNNQINNNKLLKNGWAVRIMANSTLNSFSGNIFSGNTFDLTTNSMSISSKFEANYWDKYKGYDLDRDNYGDVPFMPVKLFAVMIEKYPPLMIFLNSLFISILEIAESLFPTITPDNIFDSKPLMEIPI